MENISSKAIIIALIFVILILAFVLWQSYRAVKKLRESVKNQGSILENNFKQIKSFKRFVDMPEKLFTLEVINDLIKDIRKDPKDRTYLAGLDDKDTEDLKEFLSMHLAILFERFIGNLPLEADSLDKVVKFDHTNLREVISEIDFDRNKFQDRVNEIWKCYVESLNTSTEMFTALEYVKDKAFFYFSRHGTEVVTYNYSRDWLDLWEEKFFQILQKEQKELKEQAEIAWKNKEFETLFELVKKIELVNKNEFLKTEHRDKLLKNTRVYLEQCIEHFHNESGTDKSANLAKMYAELCLIRAQRYLTPELETT